MQNDEQKVISQTEGEIIAVTAVKTLGVFTVVFALLFTLWTLLFPMSASNFYDELGNQTRAYECAKVAVKTTSGVDKTNAKIKCVNYSISLYGKNESYARCLITDTADFLLDDDCVERASVIDQYNLASTPKSFHPAIYGYLDYVRSQNVKARAKQGDGKIWVEQELKSLNEALSSVTVSTAQQLVTLIGANPSLVNSVQIKAFANGYLTAITTKADAYFSLSGTVSLELTYEAYAYGKLKSVMLDKNIAEQSDFTQNIEFNGQTYSFDDYYEKLVTEYQK
ncbi:MAG: hypothetical protein IKC64_06215 [Clostridia bacterium]|nr:hypothetical protein [Clostridia bacterium]